MGLILMLGKIFFFILLILSICSLALGFGKLIVEIIIIGVLGIIASGLVYEMMNISFKKDDY